VPSRTIQDEDDFLLRTRSRLPGKGRQFRLEEGDAHTAGEVKDGPAGSGMDEADKVAPFVPVLDWRQGPLSLGRPDPSQDRFEPNAVFIYRPQFDAGVGEGGCHRADERPQVFLNRSWAAGSAWTWRWRGTCGEWSRRCR